MSSSGREQRTLKTRYPVLARMLRNRRAVAGALLLTVIVLGCLLADVISPYGPLEQNLRARLQGPSSEHWLGTDQFGRDLFTRILYGGRLSLAVGVVSVAIALVIGGTMGLFAGYYGGVVENVLMRIADVLLAL